MLQPKNIGNILAPHGIIKFDKSIDFIPVQSESIPAIFFIAVGVAFEKVIDSKEEHPLNK